SRAHGSPAISSSAHDSSAHDSRARGSSVTGERTPGGSGPGFEVVSEPRDERIGMISMASLKPPLRQRDALASALGERVLDRYGVVTSRGASLKWSVFRSFGVRIAPGGARPNIAIISVDTLRADHLGVYGYAR